MLICNAATLGCLASYCGFGFAGTGLKLSVLIYRYLILQAGRYGFSLHAPVSSE